VHLLQSRWNTEPPIASATAAQMTTTEDILPPADPPFRGYVGETYKASKPAWPQPVRPPAGAPNVVVILMDDLGFGHTSPYGGPIQTPHMERLATSGLRYNNFHTTALCSPTRAALMTGRNHHSVGFAAIPELSTGYPNSNSYLPKSAATVAEVLKLNGYSTFAVGKWHLAPAAHTSAGGPFDRWPLGLGFERYYGFLGGSSDHWHPTLHRDNHRIPTPRREGYHLSEDLADQAIAMLRNQQQATVDKPFFLYMAFGAPHAPLHVPKPYIERYRGKFDQGWDAVREETIARQIALGIIPPGSKLPERNPGIKAWADLSSDEQRLYARLQETFAGFVEHTDAQIGRLLAALDDMNLADNTLVMVLSDNGASQEGGAHGATNTERYKNNVPMTVAEMLQDIDAIGGPTTDPHYPAGWGMAGNTPFKRWKRDTHRGGNTDPFIVRWPAAIRDGGQVRSQYHHVTDLYPTILEAAGIGAPKVVNGHEQMRLEGQSLAYTFAADAPRAKKVQYYEMLGSRAIWADGWTAVTWHKSGTDWADDPWELYHQDEDFTQSRDLAREHPEKLKELIAQWHVEARLHNVFPLDDRFRERNADPLRRPGTEFRPRLIYYPGTEPIPYQASPKLHRCGHRITARMTIPEGGAEGVLAALGSGFGGWTLFLKDGHAHYVHNCLGMSTHHLASTLPIPAGEVTVAFEFTPTGSASGRPLDVARSHAGVEFVAGEPARGDGRLWINGQEAGFLANILTAPITYTYGGLQVGENWATTIAQGHYDGAFPFTGLLHDIVVDVQPEPPIN
jgi:arylsulfatase A-like enzyme